MELMTTACVSMQHRCHTCRAFSSFSATLSSSSSRRYGTSSDRAGYRSSFLRSECRSALLGRAGTRACGWLQVWVCFCTHAAHHAQRCRSPVPTAVGEASSGPVRCRGRHTAEGAPTEMQESPCVQRSCATVTDDGSTGADRRGSTVRLVGCFHGHQPFFPHAFASLFEK